MKHITLLALLVLPMMQSLSAQDSSFYKYDLSGRKIKDHDYFVLKAKANRTGAWVLLTLGAALAIGGELAYNSGSSDNGWDDLNNSIGAGVAVAGGILLASGSVPLFIAAAHYDKKARQTSVSFDLQKGPLEMRPTMATGYFPAVSIKFRF